MYHYVYKSGRATGLGVKIRSRLRTMLGFSCASRGAIVSRVRIEDERGGFKRAES